MKNVMLLDCTLRDGGHIVGGKFGKEVIEGTTKKLVDSNLDIVEVGFLWHEKCSEDHARFYSIEDVKKILPPKKNSKFSLMADFIDLNHLEDCDGTIEIIRLSFKRHRLAWALDTAKVLISKGYKVYINPVNCNVYSDEEYISVIQKVNELGVYGFSIVDTFGVMRVVDLVNKYKLVEKYLNKDIVIGLHLHENLGLAYSLAQELLRIKKPERVISIDGSLLGMGRTPGNLCIEQIADHINFIDNKTKYDLNSIYDAIDNFIAPLKRIYTWGYSVPYAISAKHGLHRTYAEFLMNKWKIKTSDINNILSLVDREEAEMFNEKYIENLYLKYMCLECKDDIYLKNLKDDVSRKNILIIAPGPSINEYSKKISDYASKNNCVVFGIHCVPDFVKADYIFYTNIKRFEVLSKKQTNEKVIVSSNMLRYDNTNCDLVFDYSKLVETNNGVCDDSVIMMLNVFKRIGVKNIAIAGFDGFAPSQKSFYINELSRNIDNGLDFSNRIKTILKSTFGNFEIDFLTPSLYIDYKEV